MLFNVYAIIKKTWNVIDKLIRIYENFRENMGGGVKSLGADLINFTSNWLLHRGGRRSGDDKRSEP